MSTTTTTPASRIKGHALKADGAAFTQDGERLFPNTKGGRGDGLCECGIICAETDTRKARVEWHKKHRAKVAREANAPAQAKKAPAKKEAPASGTKVEFTAAKKWWRALGQDGSTVLLSDFKDVTVDFDKDARTVVLQGDPGSVKTAAGFLEDTWELALEEFARWKVEDPGYGARGPVAKDTYKESRDRFKAQEDFLRSFCLDHEELYRVYTEESLGASA